MQSLLFFFFNDTATTEIYTLSLHDALPIYLGLPRWSEDPTYIMGVLANYLRLDDPQAAPDVQFDRATREAEDMVAELTRRAADRKSTRLNSSHANISYAVFCLKKKKSHRIK